MTGKPESIVLYPALHRFIINCVGEELSYLVSYQHEFWMNDITFFNGRLKGWINAG